MRLGLMVGVLLLSAALRAQDMHLMLDMAHYDEAYYAVDALSLLAHPRLTPFFADNFGRESLWMYVLSPFLAVFGSQAWALRLAAFFTGLLTVAAVYRLGRSLFNPSTGLWAAAAYGGLFWAVLASHQAFRAHLYPLIGVLAFAAAWRRRWLAAGVFFGLVAYTYIGARAWLVAALLAAVYVGWQARAGMQADHDRRRGLLLAAGSAFMIALPLFVYLAANPQAAGQRAEQVAISTAAQLIENGVAWLRALFWQGSADSAYNLPGRPILDLPLACLAIIGVVGIFSQRVRAWRAMLLISLLAAASLAPALLTTDTLKPLRAVGLLVPLALLIGTGADALARFGQRSPGLRAAGILVAAVLLTWAGINTSRDFAVWVRSPDLYLPMEQHIYRAMDVIARVAPPNAPVYLTPFTPDHPVLRLRAPMLTARPVSGFLPDQCLRLSAARESYYLSIPQFTPDFEQRLAQWAGVETVYAEPEGRFTLIRARPLDQDSDPPGIVFGGWLEIHPASPPPDRVMPGSRLDVLLALRTRAQAAHPLTLFVHIYGDPTPYEGGELWAQADIPVCPGSPPSSWRSDETILLPAPLQLPGDMPPGTYAIAIGVYESLSLERLPVTSLTPDLDYGIVAALEVITGP